MKRCFSSLPHWSTLICLFLGPQILMPFLSKMFASARETTWMSNLWTIHHPDLTPVTQDQNSLFSLLMSMVRLDLQNQDLQSKDRPVSPPFHVHLQPIDYTNGHSTWQILLTMS